jgi:Leucine-rich repeat (LRR) protein
LQFLLLNFSRNIQNGLAEAFAQSNLTHLLKLHLEQNGIDRVPNSRLLCDLPSLLDLHLGQNSLSELVLEVEDGCTPSLRFIDLSWNQVNRKSFFANKLANTYFAND